MTRKFMPLMLAVLLIPALIVFNSFTTRNRHIANGGGIANGKHFNFNAVVDADGNHVGHFSYDGVSYAIDCVEIDANAGTAIFYIDGDSFVVVKDNGEGKNANADQISPVTVLVNDPGCDGDLLTPYAWTSVSSGNIQVR